MRDRMLLILGLAALVGLAAVMTALDWVVERSDDFVPSLLMDFADRLLTIGAMVAAALLVYRLARLRERTGNIEVALDRAVQEGRAWRAQSSRFAKGMARAIDAQFTAWALTPAEADVAALLLKGASLREIAQLRRTSEATIRQQAQNVYRKSGLGSRAELSAYFLEDLFTFDEASPRGDAGDVPRYTS